ncbi:MAG: thiamine phosphate synthase [Candidatus Dormibacteraeota bacterium]|nr:thiamine phosphate synthase [Candidatus Dormibacteraeota bacterium]
MTPSSDRGRRRLRRLGDALLYVVTGAREERGDLRSFLDAVLRGGADVIQLREKDAEASVLLRAGAAFQRAAEEHGGLFVVNDRPDIALALGADGVHLGQDDLPVSVARQILGPDALIGVSTHTPAQFEAADRDASYLCAGPVFATPTKAGRPATGLDLVRFAADRANRHLERRAWFAIGGLDTTTLPGVVAAGAQRAVVVRAVDTDDPEAAARALRERLMRAVHALDDERENVYGR